MALREVPPVALNHQGPKVEIRGWGLELVFQDRYRWGLHGLAAVGEPCHWGTRGGIGGQDDKRTHLGFLLHFFGPSTEQARQSGL